MNKENFLFGIIGLLLGAIIGFMFANSVNQSAARPSSPMTGQNQNMPPGHPEINGNNGMMDSQVQAAVDKAKQNPKDFDAQIKAAELYYQIGRYEGAVEYLKQANQIKPDHYETIVNLGNAYFDSGNYPDAEKWYSAALGKKADDVNVRTDLGLTFMFREPANLDRAIEEFQLSLKTNPIHIQTLQNLTVAYTKKGEAAKAKETLSLLESTDMSNSAIPKLREDIQKLQPKQSS